MTIIRCPRCRDEVSVPAGATSRALVRCPLCLEQYLLAEAIAGAPPALVIIGGEVAQEAIATPPGGEDYRLAGGPAETPEYHPGRVAAANAATSMAAARPALRTARPRPRPGNPLLLIVNYVGGGVLGLALGLLVLWWGFKRDPLEMGPTFAAYVPWVVPAEFRGKLAARPEADLAAPAAANSENRRRRKRPEAPREEPLETLPAFETGEQPSATPLTPAIKTPLLTDPMADRPPRETEEPKEVDAAAAEMPVFADRGVAPDLTSLLPADWPVRIVEPSRERDFFASEDLTNAINRAAGELERYQEAADESEEEGRKAFVQLHADLSEIGRLLSYRQPGQTGLSEPIGQVESLLERISQSATSLKHLKTFVTEHWPDTPDGRGFFAVGTIGPAERAGEIFVAALEFAERSEQMPVAFSTNPEDMCRSGERILIIGRIVEEPKINLPGYDGMHAKVFQSGFALCLD